MSTTRAHQARRREPRSDQVAGPATAASLVPAAIPIALRAAGAGSVPIFLASVAALVPLAWAIGTLTEHVADRTGAPVAALLNATLGNAPELIIALVAIAHGMPEVVQASLAGSVAANVLLVLGLALLARRGGMVATPPARAGLALIALAAVALAVPSIARSSAADPILSAAIAAALCGSYVIVTRRRLAAGTDVTLADRPPTTGRVRRPIALLAVAMVLGVAVAETLVGSLQAFAGSAGLGRFFVAAVLVALVGNAVEHSAAVLLARRGRIDLAADIAISSGAQVAALLIPAAVLTASIAGRGPLTLGSAELAAVGAPAAIAALVLSRGSGRWRALVLVGAYATFALASLLAGGR